jgi:2-polyprenyl-3-methyl-5-hydroxy-6-metoxy-1,4-benzoquinol methylase
MRQEGFDVVVADAESYAFEEPFDAIIAGELIEHLPNPGRFIENAVDHLSAEGKLVLSSPNPDGFVFFRKALFDQANNPTHTCWIDPQNLLTLCEHIESAHCTSIDFLPPGGGISSILWYTGRRRASSPTWVATIVRAKEDLIED